MTATRDFTGFCYGESRSNSEASTTQHFIQVTTTNSLRDSEVSTQLLIRFEHDSGMGYA